MIVACRLFLCNMHLQHIRLVGFKNYDEAEFRFIPTVNCITGPNGKGKTNLLDAIHYLCLCKGFLNPVDSQNIRHGAPFFVIEGEFWREGKEEQIFCGLKRGMKKQFKRNKKEYERLADHIGLFPVVVISPLDHVLLTGGSEERRKFTDSLIAQFDHSYLEDLMAYNRLIAQRNALLKHFFESRKFDRETLHVYNEQLIPYGNAVYQRRKDFIERFTPVFSALYNYLSGQAEEVTLMYESHLHNGDFGTLLNEALEKDRLMQYSTVGVHKDDLIFQLNGYPVRKFGSQGQQKTYLTALKLAEHDFLAQMKGFAPILLLDDIFDKLDSDRVGKLIHKVSEEGFGQVFITDTGKEKLSAIFDKFGITSSFIHP